jgi:hypothetical protein
VAQVLKAKYFPKDSFFKAKPKQHMSYTWRSILQARWVLKKGYYWTIGNGESTDIWTDNWIHQHSNSSTWSKKPDNNPYNKVCELMDINNNGWSNSLGNSLFPMKPNKFLISPLSTDQLRTQ